MANGANCFHVPAFRKAMFCELFSFFFASGIKIDGLPIQIDAAVMVLDGDGVGDVCGMSADHGFKIEGGSSLEGEQ